MTTRATVSEFWEKPRVPTNKISYIVFNLIFSVWILLGTMIIIMQTLSAHSPEIAGYIESIKQNVTLFDESIDSRVRKLEPADSKLLIESIENGKNFLKVQQYFVLSLPYAAMEGNIDSYRISTALVFALLSFAVSFFSIYFVKRFAKLLVTATYIFLSCVCVVLSALTIFYVLFRGDWLAFGYLMIAIFMLIQPLIAVFSMTPGDSSAIRKFVETACWAVTLYQKSILISVIAAVIGAALLRFYHSFATHLALLSFTNIAIAYFGFLVNIVGFLWTSFTVLNFVIMVLTTAFATYYKEDTSTHTDIHKNFSTIVRNHWGTVCYGSSIVPPLLTQLKAMFGNFFRVQHCFLGIIAIVFTPAFTEAIYLVTVFEGMSYTASAGIVFSTIVKNMPKCLVLYTCSVLACLIGIYIFPIILQVVLLALFVREDYLMPLYSTAILLPPMTVALVLHIAVASRVICFIHEEYRSTLPP